LVPKLGHESSEFRVKTAGYRSRRIGFASPSTSSARVAIRSHSTNLVFGCSDAYPAA
jgi:hypothetical protein